MGEFMSVFWVCVEWWCPCIVGVVGIGTVGVSAEMVLGGEQRVAEVASVSVLSGLLPEL